ncbi:catalase-peroxidase [Actinoplanes tereljensis]
MSDTQENAASGCPVAHDSVTSHGSESENPAIDAPTPKTGGRPHTNRDWWPNQLDLSVLHAHSLKGNPLGESFSYAKEFAKLDVDAIKRDITEVLTTSQEWWPADFGHYGGLMIRLSWHAAGTYRIQDGRGGAGDGGQRFAPLNSWPDNANLDKARRLLWPVKAKYGQKISWADLLVLAGNVALESMGFKTFGFGFGRVDVWEPEEIFWGPEDTWLAGRYVSEKEMTPGVGATEMGLIYVNPEGPGGNANPLAAAHFIRETFGRMAMNDEETVALIAGGHTFGKTHGAAVADNHVGPEPEGRADRAGPRLAEHERFRRRRRRDHQRPRGHLDRQADPVEQPLLRDPLRVRVGAHHQPRWRQAVDRQDHRRDHPGRVRPGQEAPPDDADDRPVAARRPGVRGDLPPLPGQPRRVRAGVRQGLVQAAAPRHGPGRALPRPVGPRGPAVAGPGSGRRPRAGQRRRRGRAQGQGALKAKVLASGLSVAQLVSTAWASAASYRSTDKRGGANGARIRLEPQRSWEVNEPAAAVVTALEGIQQEFNAAGGAKISLADLIVLAGSAAVEKAASDAGVEVTVPFRAGRTDATQEQTDVESFSVLEPRADGFRNYLRPDEKTQPEVLLVDRAYMLNLTAPEATVLVGGLRALGNNFGGTQHGVLTSRPGVLTNDFFTNLLSPGTRWTAAEKEEHVYEIRDVSTDELKWTATAVDLIFGSNSQLRALAEVYASSDAQDKFVTDFVAAWTKVMELDRFDLV